MAGIHLNSTLAPASPPAPNPGAPANPGGGNAPPQAPIRERLISPFSILLLSLIFFCVATLLCLALAFDWIPGYPKSAQKNVAIYYQTAPSTTGLAVYLHPPLNSIQAPGQSQLLAFQFTNRGTSLISVRSLELFSASCFGIEPVAQGTQPGGIASAASTNPLPPLATLQPDQSVLLWYQLRAVENSVCPGQSPLVFLYTWQQQMANQPVEQQSISTGPIQVTTLRGLQWERFFSLAIKIVPVVLLPVLLAIGNYLLQDLQQRKAESQKKKEDERDAAEKRMADWRADQQKTLEQKLEVWKAVIPMMVTAIRNHYVPMVRVLVLIEDEASKPLGQADLNDILACALLFRRKINYLVDDNGGFYFRNHRGEDLCATLTNLLLAHFYDLSGDTQRFRESAEKFEPGNSINHVRQTLHINHPQPGPFVLLCARFRQQLCQEGVLDQLKTHAMFLRKIAEYEINDPFYPFWYETAPTPLNEAELRGYVPALHLSSDDERQLSKELDEYFKSLTEKAQLTLAYELASHLPRHP